MFDIIRTIILGIIEGITEWLPVSSTGHIKLASKFLEFDEMTFQSKEHFEAFSDMFDYVIQIGAILAVVVIFWNKLWPFASKKNGYIKKETLTLWSKVLVAVAPAAVAGILLDDYIEAFLGEGTLEAVVIATMLIIYGFLFIIVENINAKRTPKTVAVKDLAYKDALLIGFFQVLSIIPGTSRSGATILGAMILGVSRTAAAEYSFFMAVPVICGAGLLKFAKYTLEYGFINDGLMAMVLIVGLIVSFLVSIVAIKFLLGYVKKKDFKFFGYYRIVLGIFVLAYFLFLAR